MIAGAVLLGLCFGSVVAATLLVRRGAQRYPGRGHDKQRDSRDTSSSASDSGHWALFLGSHSANDTSAAHHSHHSGSPSDSGHDCSSDSSCGGDSGGGCDGGGGSD